MPSRVNVQGNKNVVVSAPDGNHSDHWQEVSWIIQPYRTAQLRTISIQRHAQKEALAESITYPPPNNSLEPAAPNSGLQMDEEAGSPVIRTATVDAGGHTDFYR